METISKHIKPLLALIVVTMTYVIFMIILFRYSKDNNAISQVIIAVVGGFGVATGYYFGYSSGRAVNEKKDNPLATTESGNVIVTKEGDTNEK